MSRFGAIGFASVASRVYGRRTNDGAASLNDRIITQIVEDRRNFAAPHPADPSAEHHIERLRVAAARNASARPR